MIAASPSLASADDGITPTSHYAVTPSLDVPATKEPPQPERRFYGWQNMVVGYAGIGMMAATIKSGGALPFFGFGVYALGGPIVHIGHEQYARAAGSLVINVITPLLMGAVAHSMDKPCDRSREDGCSLDTLSTAISGVVVGMLAAPLIDGLTMGWEDAPRKPPPEISLQPTLTIARKEANGGSTTMLGLAGAF
jgi:hypothetical protein